MFWFYRFRSRKYDIGMVIEFKKVDEEDNESLEDAVNAALAQIKYKNYKQELLDRKIENVLELGIAFQGKELIIKQGQ